MRRLILILTILLLSTYVAHAALQDAWDGRLAYYSCETNVSGNFVMDEGTYINNATFYGFLNYTEYKVGAGACQIDTWSVAARQPENPFSSTQVYTIDTWVRWGDSVYPDDVYPGLGDFDNPYSFYNGTGITQISYLAMDPTLPGFYQPADGSISGKHFHENAFNYQNANPSINNMTPEHWIHLVVTENETHTLFYFNTDLRATANKSGPSNRDTLINFSFGGGNSDSNRWSGHIDNMLITSYNYTEADVIASYNSYLGTDFSSLSAPPTVPTLCNITSGQYEVDDFVANASGSVSNDTITYYYQFESGDGSSILQAYSASDTYSGCNGDAACNSTGDILVRCKASTVGGESGIQNSSVVDILAGVNTPPVISNVNVTPDTAYTTSTLTCNWSYSDADNDTQGSTYVRWYVNDGLVKSQTYSGSNPTLASSFFSKTQTVKCSVLGNDGSDNSTGWKNDSVTILNSPPTYSTLTLSPSPAQKTDTLTCSVSGRADADGDTMTNSYVFYDSDNTTILQGWSTTNTLDCDAIGGCEAGDHILCKAVVSDGAVNSTIKNASATIANTKPVAQSVFIQPASPDGSNDINCTYSYFDADGDAEAATYFSWFMNGTKTGITTQVVPNGVLNTSDRWKCGVIVNDGTQNSTQVNSTTVIINTASPTNILISDNGTVDEGNAILFTWSWDDPQLPGGGPYTHYLCNSTNISEAGCGDTTICEIEDNTSTTNCSFAPSSDYLTNNTFYLQVYDGLNFSSPIEPHTWNFNHKPTIGALSLNVSATDKYNTYSCQAVNVTDIDGDETFVSYTFLDSNDTTIQSYSGTNTFIVNTGAAVRGDNIKCQARVFDFRIYSDVSSVTDHLRISGLSYPSSVTVDNFASITVSINNASSFSGVNVSIRSPLNQLFSELEMTYLNESDVWSYSFAPNIVGEWDVVSFKMGPTEEGESYLYSTTSDSITVNVDDGDGGGGGGGGGGGSRTIIQEVAFSGNNTLLTGFCGDNVCAEGENPSNCWQDCRVNYDTLVTCLFDEELECNWRQNWFPVFLIVSLGAITLFVVYRTEANK